MARKKLETLTEQMFYVLLSLRRERHGYGVMQAIAALSQGRVKVGAGTLYALLERFERDGFIRRTHTEDTRKYYCLTPEGERALLWGSTPACGGRRRTWSGRWRRNHEDMLASVCLRRGGPAGCAGMAERTDCGGLAAEGGLWGPAGPV